MKHLILIAIFLILAQSANAKVTIRIRTKNGSSVTPRVKQATASSFDKNKKPDITEPYLKVATRLRKSSYEGQLNEIKRHYVDDKVNITSNFQETEKKVLEIAEKRFGKDHIASLHKLIFAESSWNHMAKNKTSGACGLFQAYPCEKMKCELTDIDCQANWGLDYIERRYGNPTNAYNFWLSKSPHWY